MLHSRRALAEVAVSSVRRWVLAGALILIAAAIAGVRGPTEGRLALAAGEEEAQIAIDLTRKKNAEPVSLDYVPAQSNYLLAARPVELAGLKKFSNVYAALVKAPLFEAMGLPLEEIEEMKLALSLNPDRRSAVLVVRSTKPHDWKKFGSYLLGQLKIEEIDGRTCYRSTRLVNGKTSDALVEHWLPDDRTIVLTTFDSIRLTFEMKGLPWAEAWNQAAAGPFSLRMDSKLLVMLAAGKPDSAEPPKIADQFDAAYFRGQEQSGEFQFTSDITCQSAAGAGEVAQALRELISQLEKVVANSGYRPLLAPMTLQFVRGAKVTVDGSTVHSLAVADPFELTKLVQGATAAAAALSGSVEPTNEHRHAHVTNKLKQLAIALLLYHDAFKRFPAAAPLGPDGKTPHSWRVEILPFLEGPLAKSIHERYKLDEPWDSEHNRALIKEGAEFFSVPSAPDDCAIYVVTGPGTTFDVTKPPSSIRSVIDGTSKTISLVEAQRSIPWTKPEDIEVDPEKPLTKLGGFSQDGFQVALLDGSVHLLPNDADEKLLKKLVTKAGREPVSIQDAIDSGAKPAKPAPSGKPTTPDKPAAKPKSAPSSSTSADSPAARRAAAMTQLKYIALAMHNYHNKNARFPAAVVIGPDGKTPHSWRVELLPYLEDPRGKEIYDRYKLDEPWDSEHNKALLKEGAAWFGSPGESETGNSAYFVVTGPGSMFEADKLPAIKTISDGLSNTIGVVEAKRAIPWTKPEDIYIDPGKPLPELGGYFAGGFNAAIMDGSVHFLPADIDETVFKKLVTNAGGEVVTIPHGESPDERKARPQPEGERQTEAHRKLQDIGIALQNYHDAQRHFPSAIVIGPDGKTPHSWRVEILRFLNSRSQAVFARYKLDEPWDSEANQALSKEGAEFFNVSGTSDSENAAFFMVTGPGMMFDADQPAPSVRKIIDGTSKTIGIVEAKRSIPWMKPEDIRIEIDKPLPELGGIFKNGFHVGLMDSSVVFVPNDTDPDLLKQYFTRAGREPAAGLGMPRGKSSGAQPLQSEAR